MKYRICKFSFAGIVHFGNNSLVDSNVTFMADTLFSAMCHEAVGQGEDVLDRLYNIAASGMLCLSDAFPYVGYELFLPKPYLKVETEEKSGDSTVKKAYKNLKYIPLSKLDEYLKGKYDVLGANSINENFGVKQVKVSAAVRGGEETVPYRIGLFSFNKGNGLYSVLGYERDEDFELVKGLLTGLSYSGIGGKRKAGLGRYDLIIEEADDELAKRLEKKGSRYMTISCSLPKEDELDRAMEGAHYTLVKRSGFVSSEKYSEEQQKKKDLFVFKSGSCFKNMFCGDIYDVSTKAGSHPVYRYERPMFLEVDA